ncbi:aquaporin [Oerskovia enterophila]|uniref:Aquaporin Z n=1 Tax=Oerskovia enterophila TaxID=43678 RepID=A0A163SKT1_9CELL|nr:aquaporin [Oerskovia enterophila]KZM36531.1 aquaporin Z [Oerskovia enterophila]OCI29872.1 aquaporin Z [Oerskovia enterophila]
MSQDTSAPDAVVVEEATVVVGPSLLARLGAEAFGTFFLVLSILGVALYGRFTGAGLVLPVALAGGIALLAAIAAVGHVSGGHFNPAVTLGAAIGGRTAWRDVLPYWLAQIVGGIIASLILFATLPSAALPILQQNAVIADATKQAFISGTANGFGEHSPLAASTSGAFSFEWFSAFLIEVVVTAIFVGVILGVTDKRSNSKLAPTAIGLSLAALLLIAAPFTNGSLNPARSIAAAIFSDSWALSQLWLFIVAPLVGAAIAALFYRAFAFAPVQDDLLAEDEVFVVEEETDLTGAPAATAAVVAEEAASPAVEVPEAVETVEVTEVEVTETEVPEAGTGKDSTDEDGTAPKA